MTIELKNYANDIKLNLSSILREDSNNPLTRKQTLAIALACAYSTKNQIVIEFIKEQVGNTLSSAEIEATKGAASVMSMNNIYYRFVHLASNKEYQQMPAKLRMNIINNHGIDKVDFELYSLAVSAINGCGMCIDAHVAQLEKANVSKNAIQDTVRIAAIINAAATAVTIN
ncbi:MAG: alkyl hydroperoxide reductase [Alphaproteobacteria bacterium]|jgi:lipoyl-dependent peroxiredoxin subunit D|nr:alkyl hydroperoxide reductase [Alphaproteobacteria bacterium]